MKSQRRRVGIVTARLVVFAVLLLSWQFVPTIAHLDRSRFFDPFFISSPRLVADRLYDLLTTSGNNTTGGGVSLWPYLWPTLRSSAVGAAIGVGLGALCGLVFSNFQTLSDVLRPFLVAANAVPRIAMIPILVLLFGITFEAVVLSAVLLVFFVVFFNAYEGGKSVPPHLIENAKLLGASEWQVMRWVRLPFVLAWTIAAMPNAATFSLLAVVTTEILTGYQGLGQLLGSASSTSDATLTFTIVVVLSVMGVVMVGGLELFKRRVLHWWGS